MWYLLIVALVVALDQLSKTWIIGHLRMYEIREVIPDIFNLVYLTNTGAAFSFLADVDSPWRHWFFLSISAVAVIGFTVYNYHEQQKGAGVLLSVAFGCIVGGAIGNSIDRLRYGAVTDFLDVYYGSHHWPAFNLADSCICIGAGILCFVSVFASNCAGNREENKDN